MEFRRHLKIKRRLKTIQHFRIALADLFDIWEGDYSNLNKLLVIRNHPIPLPINESVYDFIDFINEI